MADWGKRGEGGIQKFEHLENKKNFLDEIKSIFHELSFDEKKENSGHRI